MSKPITDEIDFLGQVLAEQDGFPDEEVRTSWQLIKDELCRREKAALDAVAQLAAAEAENTRLKRAIEAHQLQSVGWRETTVVDRELWAAGVEDGT